MSKDKAPPMKPESTAAHAESVIALGGQPLAGEEPRSPQLDEVHRRVERNFLRYQEIETALKSILPYIHPDGGRNGAAAVRHFQKTRVDGKTLGQLLLLLKEAIEAVPRAGIPERLDAILKSRNDLTHHFYRIDEIDLLRPGAYQRTLDYLEQQWRDTNDFYMFLRESSYICLHLLMEVHPELEAEFSPYLDRWRKLRLPPGAPSGSEN